MTPFHIIIPARLQSTRLPRKVLLLIAGKTMLEHTWTNALQSGARTVTIATDNKEVAQIAEAFGAQVVLSQQQHDNGTSRIAEAIHHIDLADEDIVVNVQADEPRLPAEAMYTVATACEHADIATLAVRIRDVAEFLNPNVVKVVCDRLGFANYFSRSTIPFTRDLDLPRLNHKQLSALPALRHLGLYAYSVQFLKQYPSLSEAPAEAAEQLEQLRFLYHSAKIKVDIYPESLPPGVDTADDLKALQSLMEEGNT